MLTAGDHSCAREVMVCEDSLSVQPAPSTGWVAFYPFETRGVSTYKTAFDSKKFLRSVHRVYFYVFYYYIINSNYFIVQH